MSRYNEFVSFGILSTKKKLCKIWSMSVSVYSIVDSQFIFFFKNVSFLYVNINTKQNIILFESNYGRRIENEYDVISLYPGVRLTKKCDVH